MGAFASVFISEDEVEKRRDRFRPFVEKLYHWQYGSDKTNFSSQIFSLMGKADAENEVRLYRGFKEYVIVWKLWYYHPNPPQFFKEWLGYEVPAE